MCLVLFFSFFDLSDNSKVACAIIRSALKSMHTQKSPKGHNIASCKQWAVSKWCTQLAKVPVLRKQPEPRRSGGNHSRDNTDPTLALPRAGIHWQPQLQALLSMDKTPILKTGLFKSELLLIIL